MRKDMKWLTVIIALQILTACSSAPMKSESSADRYCHLQGGTLSYEKRLFGKTGYCVLPDGTRIEHWRLYLKNRLLP
ncbi:DUF333 domain-containing protein [Pantoea agglomerans]|uniref:DUF333 domain-containing protein n=2 Tax=Enterobacter agglomerans TaxID=549 RepID=A0ACC5PVR7_ENTAG|nr:DUF333 domain-containing protein [Pantoea agglomerans]MBD8129196.1 DUF333 domain-containing protein [Pantoea agglomerans]MBD8156449.1 DUF333 domain-containing protein [Pantoea agglomerans]MBD8157712.1 DUF333 domain-containing protein [Pantoea agglomerans]MBD8231551.1 DUF333 domain-containing protein [Pantoea agglomerans]MBD8241754.1 DUF333 domain-containing protein [Pantoea agglomerans]